LIVMAAQVSRMSNQEIKQLFYIINTNENNLQLRVLCPTLLIGVVRRNRKQALRYPNPNYPSDTIHN